MATLTRTERQFEIVERRRPENRLTGEYVTYWCFRDRVTGCPFGRRYATLAEAQAAFAASVERDRAELAKACVLCGHPAGEHVNYECPTEAATLRA